MVNKLTTLPNGHPKRFSYHLSSDKVITILLAIYSRWLIYFISGGLQLLSVSPYLIGDCLETVFPSTSLVPERHRTFWLTPTPPFKGRATGSVTICCSLELVSQQQGTSQLCWSHEAPFVSMPLFQGVRQGLGQLALSVSLAFTIYVSNKLSGI